MNDDEILSIHNMQHSYHQRMMKIYIPDQKMIQQNED